MNKDAHNSIPKDTISRAAAIDALDKCHCGGKDENGRPWIYKENAVEAIEMVEPSPSAEPKKGTWIDTRGNTEWYAREYECSECGGTMLGESNFCPNCGAEMEVTE